MSMVTLICPSCGHSGTPELHNSTKHITATCICCGSYIKHVAQIEMWIDEFNRQLEIKTRCRQPRDRGDV